MRKVLAILLIGFSLTMGAGCARINPRVDPHLEEKIDNQNGKIRDMENIQNGIKNDINGIKQDAEITNSKLDHVQNGMLNMQESNNGIQIFSGNGGLIVGFCVILIMAFVILSYRKQAVVNAKAADMLAARIVCQKNEDLEEDVFKAALYSDVEEKVYGLIKKHQQALKAKD